MPKIFTSKKQRIGEIGENIAVKFLVKHGFNVLERNYTKKWGEIDIITEKENKLYFIEVKSVSRITLPNLKKEDSKAIDNTKIKSEYRPEENMHPQKIKRISRTIQTYLISKKIPEDKTWQVDLFVVYLDLENKKAKIKIISDIVL